MTDRERIRQDIKQLERQKPKDLEAFEFREAEIGRLLDMLINGGELSE